MKYTMYKILNCVVYCKCKNFRGILNFTDFEGDLKS